MLILVSTFVYERLTINYFFISVYILFMHITKSKEPSIAQWVSDLRIGNNDWFDELYEDNRTIFFQWIERNHKLSKDEALDIYQNTMIVLFENVKHGRIKELNASVTTYIFGIAKNLIYKYHRKNEMINRHEVRLNEHYHFIATNASEMESASIKVQLELEGMKEPCRSILALFYMAGLKLSAIAEKLEYSSIDVLKTQKSRCLKKLKGIFN